MLYDVLRTVDTSGDGQIQYQGVFDSSYTRSIFLIHASEFRVFVDHAERELWQLFESIDKDQDGVIDKHELRAAFSRAGIAISSAKLDQFFEEVDTNNDNVITFEEWR